MSRMLTSCGSFAAAGAAGIMLEDQVWPKRKLFDI
jgi:2-methylisocitrate lyase-like PEP mutase family enzyme